MRNKQLKYSVISIMLSSGSFLVLLGVVFINYSMLDMSDYAEEKINIGLILLKVVPYLYYLLIGLAFLSAIIGILRNTDKVNMFLSCVGVVFGGASLLLFGQEMLLMM